ncbi:MAG: hypothetical protein B7Y25_04510 [Alphaproteobacteria bacterium 16-39-46]|nr:MAG: hypothetical protein B7Y25_04510 [Alphaproteobacteria bacterium 16-39-46]OZA42993.1 MAG: hypothetical protein B7X84_04430 [Alphaproteobacteria bacterium 17-39-52]HQS84145.1 hypothetical protein [Alphaproteobacteria bacterium]HQS94006.1 hypothetical protein [Alphaproteobacteria bacterium]
MLKKYSAEQFNLSEAEYDAYLRSRLAQEADDLMMNKMNKEIAESIEKGEKINAQKTVLKLFKMGIDLDKISQATDLTRPEIEALIKEEKNPT